MADWPFAGSKAVYHFQKSRDQNSGINALKGQVHVQTRQRCRIQCAILSTSTRPTVPSQTSKSCPTSRSMPTQTSYTRRLALVPATPWYTVSKQTVSRSHQPSSNSDLAWIRRKLHIYKASNSTHLKLSQRHVPWSPLLICYTMSDTARLTCPQPISMMCNLTQVCLRHWQRCHSTTKQCQTTEH